MAVTVASLMAPEGPLEYGFFPETTAEVDVRVQRYIDRSVAKVAAYPGTVADTDAAVRAWALHLAFYAAWLLKSNTPATASMQDVGSRGFSTAQIDAFKDEADRYRLEYLALAPTVPDTTNATSSGTQPVRNVVQW